MSIGYSINVTQMQMVKAYSIIANGGKDIDLTLIKTPYSNNSTKQVIDYDSSERLKNLLINVVEGENGTGRSLFMENYIIGGKTGTSRTHIEGVGYSDYRFNTSFTGFIETNEGPIVGSIILWGASVSPYTEYVTGGSTAAPIFKNCKLFSTRRINLKNLNLDYLKSLDIDYSKVVNHTFDVVEGSILCINHDDNNKLNEYVSSSLNKNPELVITSNKCSIQDEKVLRFDDYDTIFSHILEGISPNYRNLNYFGITGTNGKTTTAFYLNQLIGTDNLFIGTIDEKNKYSFTNEKILTTPKLFNVVKLISLQQENISSVSLEVSSHALDQKD